MRIIAFITEAPAVRQIFAHLGEATSPPPLTLARGPPLWEIPVAGGRLRSPSPAGTGLRIRSAYRVLRTARRGSDFARRGNRPHRTPRWAMSSTSVVILAQSSGSSERNSRMTTAVGLRDTCASGAGSPTSADWPGTNDISTATLEHPERFAPTRHIYLDDHPSAVDTARRPAAGEWRGLKQGTGLGTSKLGASSAN